ncbi:group II intron reverse transcriptase/maturase [Streptomyces fulvoviolaceus]|uniref:group II intron reverse transcriptase/maturase n=1 Tax=Streptomyces fulvoviolaceus TaxID=285535 RepID=UPI0021BEE4A1|nr:group II intron reverse transcriptase/maturase [Streptomyces fulvoviolaceus]MCT9083815.1 group II intron reverse transcriptase/maturase [Streptomyces fulvoviolaceus]
MRNQVDAAESSAADASATVNGPEGDPEGWLSIDWQRAEGNVRRLRQRIFTATKAGDLKRVRSLQKLLLRSRSNAQLSVRRVTEINEGRATAGIDGKVVMTSRAKLEWSRWAQHSSKWKPLPVKRVYIPKMDGRSRPLGIPVIADRIVQAVVVNALEPEWEARFEPRSYGFRPGRGCHDAIEALFNSAKGKNPRRKWVLDADLAMAFDRIDHNHLLRQIGLFPARGRIEQWLAAGVVEKGRFTPTREGTPQGGVISPLLMNVALHGMEEAAGVRYRKTGRDAGNAMRNSPVLVRYADDLAVLCESHGEAERVKSRLSQWLAPRGLTFNEAKTRIVHLDEGFDFLGFTIRRYGGEKLLIKPSIAAVKRIRKRLSTEMRELRGANSEAVIGRLNPIIRGWAAYYRTAVSSKTYSTLDDHMWRLAYKWAKHSHPNKSKAWVTSRYFGRFHPSRRDRWIFGDRASGRYLTKFSWTKIARHQIVTSGASPDDPGLVEYWARRRRREKPLPVGRPILEPLRSQNGACPICGTLLLSADHPPQSPEEWEKWQRMIPYAIAKQSVAAEGAGRSGGWMIRLVHVSCRQRIGVDTR